MNSAPGELYRTNDGGRTWSLIAATETGSLPFAGEITMSSPETGFLLGGIARMQLYRTTDGGKSWQEQELPIPAGFENERRHLSPKGTFFSRQDGFLEAIFAEDAFLYKTHDGGRTWLPQHVPAVEAVSFSDTSHGFIWKTVSPWSGLAAPISGSFYHTAYGVGTWTAIEPTGDLKRALDNGERIWQLDFVSDRVGWALLWSASGQSYELPRTCDGVNTQ